MSFLINPYAFNFVPTPQNKSITVATALASTVAINTPTVTFNSVIGGGASLYAYAIHWRNAAVASTLSSFRVTGTTIPIITQTQIQSGATGVGIALVSFRWSGAGISTPIVLTFNNNVTVCEVKRLQMLNNFSDTPYAFTATTKTSGTAITMPVNILGRSMGYVFVTHSTNNNIVFSSGATTYTATYNTIVPTTTPTNKIGGLDYSNSTSDLIFLNQNLTITTTSAVTCYANVFWV